MKLKIAYIFLSIVLLCSCLFIEVSALNFGGVTPYPEMKIVNLDEMNNEWYKEARSFVNDEAIIMNQFVYKEIGNEADEWDVYYYNFYGSRPIMRSEVVTILSRYNGSYDTIDAGKYIGSSCEDFVDVPDGQWYTPAAQWAYENGIVNGVGGAYFAPERTITREEFAAMLYRYTEYLEVDTSARVDYSDFADSGSVSEWATDAMSWAVAEGLISGKPGKLLAPQDTITRAEVATVIYRYNNEVKAHRDIWDGQPW